ncbi:MAG: hypothetical protein GX053_05980 [Tissierella sp.]|nr:hypothetical protein [Tissierella sp.]
MDKGKSNLTPKILSVIIAIILWSYVMGIKNPDWPREYRNINVEFTNIEVLDRQNLVVMDPQEAKINVSVTGRKSDMDGFTAANNIVAKLDLSGYKEGQTRVPVLVSLKDSASTVRITDWEPSDILVTIDRVVTEERTVNIRTEGEVPENHTVGDLVAKPETILLRGPRSWINDVTEVFAVVSIKDRTTTTNITAPVQLRDGQDNAVVGLEMNPSVVDITIPIYRKNTLPIEVVLENELPEEYVITKMEVVPSTIGIRGGNSIADLTSIKTKPIDVNLLLEDPSLEVELDLLDNIELLDPNERVTINAVIERIDTKEFEFEFSEIDIRNLDEELVLAENSRTITVSIVGTESFLETITKDVLKPYIDLSNLSEGEHEVEIEFEEVQGVTIESIVPESLTINLSNR